jgi:hypothetical protein
MTTQSHHVKRVTWKNGLPSTGAGSLRGLRASRSNHTQCTINNDTRQHTHTATRTSATPARPASQARSSSTRTRRRTQQHRRPHDCRSHSAYSAHSRRRRRRRRHQLPSPSSDPTGQAAATCDARCARACRAIRLPHYVSILVDKQCDRSLLSSRDDSNVTLCRPESARLDAGCVCACQTSEYTHTRARAHRVEFVIGARADSAAVRARVLKVVAAGVVLNRTHAVEHLRVRCEHDNRARSTQTARTSFSF